MITLRMKDCKILNRVLECLEYYGYHWLSSGHKPTETRMYKSTLPKIDVALTLHIADKKIAKGASYYIIDVIE